DWLVSHTAPARGAVLTVSGSGGGRDEPAFPFRLGILVHCGSARHRPAHRSAYVAAAMISRWPTVGRKLEWDLRGRPGRRSSVASREHLDGCTPTASATPKLTDPLIVQETSAK